MEFNTTSGADVALAASFLKDGLPVAIPTETVYGLACNALDEIAVSKVFELKQRPSFDPLIIHVGSRHQAEQCVREINSVAAALMDAFWPGPLTLLLPKSDIIPDIVTSGLDTVGIRMPNHPLTLQLLLQLDFPLAAPSANPFGYISPTSATHVMSHFNGLIPHILDGGLCQVGIESTIVGFKENKPVIYRLGGISAEAIKALVGDVIIFEGASAKPSAPGMLKSHYAPCIPLMLGDVCAITESHPGKKIAVITFSGISMSNRDVVQFVLSESGNTAEAARNLFRLMREIDSEGFDLIAAERMPSEGLGRAINDRLSRAAAEKDH